MWAKALLIVGGGMAGVVVYFGTDVLVRLLNPRRARPLDEREVTVLDQLAALGGSDAPWRVLDGIDPSTVRLAPSARLPIKHRAITLGRTVFVKGDLDVAGADDRELFVHELVHVAQSEALGRLGMAWRYSSLYCDGFSYSEHAMEVQARAVAAAAQRALG